MKKNAFLLARAARQFVKHAPSALAWFFDEWRAYCIFLERYGKGKFLIFSNAFEGNKNQIVKSILIRRGRRNRMFLHLAAMSILTVGLLISPFISDSNPFSAPKTETFAKELAQGTTLSSDDVFSTQTNDKIRDKIITYTVQKGDTVGTIAERFNISADTVRWVNDLKDDSITTGDELKILPVTGIAHKVESGDTIYSIAKKYSANPQAIADFPFQAWSDPQTFSLVIGQIVIVPDGVKPADQAKPEYVKPTYATVVSPGVVGATGFAWPVNGALNQGYSWYHRAIDLGASVGTPVVAAQSGIVSEVHGAGWNYGYGIHVVISGENGYSTLYAHMSGVNVAAGASVTAGKTVIGWVGLTGRTTGSHLHFEVRSGGGNVNPLSFLH